MDYREIFMIGGRKFGIEDYEGGKDHFMPDRSHKRFRLWVGGCRFGQADTIDEARSLLHSYAVSEQRATLAGHQERALHARMTLDKLGDDSFNLGAFRTSPTSKPKVTV